MLVIGVGATLIAVPPPASAATDVGDLLGIISGNGPDPPPPPQSRPPDSGEKKSPDRPPPPSTEGLLAPESSCPGQSDPRLPVAAQKRAMVCMQSYARAAKGLSALRSFKPLRVSATRKARDIKRCQGLSHEACGRNPWHWIARVGFFKGSWVAGEILAAGDGPRGTVRATMKSWLRSKPHRVVLLHRRFDQVGIGTVTGRFRGFRGMRIWVAHLGYRR